MSLAKRSTKKPAAVDPIRELIAVHAAMLGENPYAYFELARTRQSEWMAWICDKPFHESSQPPRKVLARGQALTPDGACTAALFCLKERGWKKENGQWKITAAGANRTAMVLLLAFLLGLTGCAQRAELMASERVRGEKQAAIEVEMRRLRAEGMLPSMLSLPSLGRDGEGERGQEEPRSGAPVHRPEFRFFVVPRGHEPEPEPVEESHILRA